MVDIAPLNPPRTAAENPRSYLTFEPASRCADSLGMGALCRSEPVAENRGPKFWASWAPSTGPQRMASYFLRRMPSHADLARPGQLLSIRIVRKGHTGFESSNAGRYFRSREYECIPELVDRFTVQLLQSFDLFPEPHNRNRL